MKKQDESQALTVKGENLEGTQKELDIAVVYLKFYCVDAGVNYEDRVAQRVGQRWEKSETLEGAF